MSHTAYTVFINQIGALPEAEPLSFYRLADVKDYLRSIRDELADSDTQTTIITPLHHITRKALAAGNLVYLQTKQLHLVSVRLEEFDEMSESEIQSRQTTAEAIPPDCMYTSDSQDLNSIAYHFRSELLSVGIHPQDITGAFVLTAAGDYSLLYVTDSPSPYLTTTIYYRLVGDEDSLHYPRYEVIGRNEQGRMSILATATDVIIFMQQLDSIYDTMDTDEFWSGDTVIHLIAPDGFIEVSPSDFIVGLYCLADDLNHAVLYPMLYPTWIIPSPLGIDLSHPENEWALETYRFVSAELSEVETV